jgi:tetratricopeptide (TPR) repeat protein
MFKILTVILLLLGALSSYAQQIDALILNNDYDKALQLIDQELVKNEEQPLLHYKKGIVLQKKYDYSGALKSFETAWLLDSTDHKVVSELADVNTILGNHKQALPYYKTFYYRDTTNTIQAIRLAKAFFNLRSYREPYKILFAVYLRDSTNLYVNKQLAFAASRTGHDSLAIVLYHQIIASNATDLNNYTNLVSIYQKKEKYNSAIETIEQGLSVYPDEVLLLSKLGDLHYANRDYQRAIGSYERLLSFGDSIPEVVKNLGVSYYYVKRYDEGIYLLEKSLTMKPNDPVAALFAGLCYMELKQLDESINYLRFASETAIPYYMSDIYNQWGNICIQKREYKKSVELLKKAYRLDSTKYDILFKIGNTYDVWQKDKSQAIRYYNSYLKSPKEENEMHRKLTEYVLERKKKLAH